MFQCKYCQNQNRILIFKPQPNRYRRCERDPKYNFMIKCICAKCNKFQCFEKQTDELMDELRDCAFVKIDLSEGDVFST
jgi:hypothetical protein